MKLHRLVFLFPALLVLGACESRINLDEARYWERSDVREATYLEEPKAQNMLHKDIADCVVSMRELEREQAIRHAIPGDTGPDGVVPDPATAEGSLAQWDTPDHKGYLRAEHSDSHDFENCMQAKGWDRLEYMPYDVADRARKNYMETVYGERLERERREKARIVRENEETDWDKLNR